MVIKICSCSCMTDLIRLIDVHGTSWDIQTSATFGIHDVDISVIILKIHRSSCETARTDCHYKLMDEIDL